MATTFRNGVRWHDCGKSTIVGSKLTRSVVERRRGAHVASIVSRSRAESPKAMIMRRPASAPRH
jgi:hypothetical protein